MDPRYGGHPPVTFAGIQPVPPPWNLYDFYKAYGRAGPWNSLHVDEPLPRNPLLGEPVQSNPHLGEPLQRNPLLGPPVQGNQVPVEPVQSHPLHNAFLFPTQQRLAQSNALGYKRTASPSDCATLPPDSGYAGSRPAYSAASPSAIDDDGFAPRRNLNAAKSFRCEDCNALLKSQGELKKHRQRHIKPHLCPYPGCPKAQQGFSTSNDLVRHKRSVHKEHGLPGRCFVCIHCNSGDKPPKIWPRADNFRSHLSRAHQMTLDHDADLKDYVYQSMTQGNDLEGVGEGVGTSMGLIDPQNPPKSLQVCAIFSEQDQLMGSQVQEGQTTQGNGQLPTQMTIDPAMVQQSSAEADQSQPPPIPLASEEANYVDPLALLELAREVSRDGTPHDKQHAADALGYSHVQLLDDGNDHNDHNDHNDMKQYLSVASPNELAGENATEEDRGIWKLDGPDPDESYQLGHNDLNVKMLQLEQSQPEVDESSATGSTRIPAPDVNSTPAEILNFLKKIPRELLQTALTRDEKDTEDGSQADEEKGHFDCEEPNCGKVFSRQCELKKHKKRHDKPYGCTFKSCSKRFGSKNDWKRHESSQHFQLETWNCDIAECKKTYQRREGFKNHLQNDHTIDDMDKIDEKLEACRLGRHCDPRFWCGFCVRVVEINVKERGGNSWTKRCDHIDNHLFGKEGLQSKCISEWKHQDEEKDLPASSSSGAVYQASGGMSPEFPAHCDLGSNGKKRRRGTDGITKPRKRAAKEKTYIWECCKCSQTNNLRTSSCCFECSHRRCSSDCRIEYVTPNADESLDEETDTTGRTDLNTVESSQLQEHDYDL